MTSHATPATAPDSRLAAGVLRIAVAILALILIALPALAQSPAQSPADPFRTRLTDAKARLDTVDMTLARPALDDATLSKLRDGVEPLRNDLVALQGEATGPRDAAKARLDKLGPAPKPEEPPESADVAAARKREQQAFGDLDGVIKEAQVQVVRVDQIANTITERRREAFAARLLERSSSILDPNFWLAVGADLPRSAWSLSLTLEDARTYLVSRLGWASAGWALAILVGGFALARFLRLRLWRMRERLGASERGPVRFLSAFETVLSILYALAGWPMLVLVPVLALDTADLLADRALAQLGTGLLFAVTVAVVYDATAEGLLSVHAPRLRLLPLSDWAVKRIRRRTRWNAVILGLYTLASSVGKAIYAPISLTIASTAIAALMIALTSVTLLLRLRKAPSDGEGGASDEINKLDILRPIIWILVIAVLGCLFTGYIALAGFFAIFPLSAVFIAALAYTLMVLVDAGLMEGLAGDGQRSRAVARAIGISPKNFAFAGTLLSGVLRFLIIAVAAMVLVGPLGLYSADVFAAIQRAFFGFQVGGFTISPSAILLGLALLVLILIITRFVQSWIRGTLLPRTTLDAGLQNSIATIIGYVGVVLAGAIALSEVGLDLQNFAIVAGALSVGIGFGLQSIVSNFVSGLILLAERPIRVGDIIAVSGEEGFVRRISVRATEIETYDRATLIIPNSQLITGTVKNWVYGNTWSRVKVSLAVGYDVDVEAVRAAMLSAAEGDPRILPSPPPRVFLSKLGDASLEFELIAVVASVETLAAVRSDLHLKILKAFRARGLRVAAQLPAAPAPVVVSLTEALGAVEAAKAAAAQTPSEGR